MTRRYNPTSSATSVDKEELQANTAISDLITNINILIERKNPLINPIKSPKLLIRGLKELQSMVEMVDIKYSIVNQIKFLITNQARKQTLQTNTSISQFEGHMLHSVISGNPGTGKTTVGMILAKIWMALGFINKTSPSDKENLETQASNVPILLTNTIVNTVNESYRKRIQELEENQRNNHRNLDKIREMLNQYQTISGEIRRKAIRLKPGNVSDKCIYYENRDIDKEWESFLTLTRSLRFGFDELIREANSKYPTPGITGSTGLNIVMPKGTEEIDPYENVDPKFVIASREDLIAEYLGQTAPKTKKVLESAKGGVLFIDEAYSLCNMDGGSKDKYGEECLATINEFMSLHPDEIIIIFAGYKDKLMSSIFKAQPGLFRRCTWMFEIKDYTCRGLSKILTKQLARNSWTISPDINIEKLLLDNKDIIKDGGGGTDKLAFQAKIAYGNAKFIETVNAQDSTTVLHDSIITMPMLIEALAHIRENGDDRMLTDEPPEGMFN